MKQNYVATKSRSQGRLGWSAIFRHPLRLDKSGNPLRVRKGLATRDESEADRLIEKLNILLRDQAYWALTARDRAAQEMDPIVVSIFYDDIEKAILDPWDAREKVIPIPTHDDGYIVALLAGPTGSGKTTLIRQFVGTHPKRDRFPSTSTAKTTIFDTEIILRESDYSAVVTFLPKDHVRFYIEECVNSAVSAAAEDKSDYEIMRKLLEHSEQRFRLSYLLGTLPADTEELDDDYDEITDDAGDVSSEEIGESEITSEERESLKQKLKGYLKVVIGVAEKIKTDVSSQLELESQDLKSEDFDALLGIIEDEVRQSEQAQTLIDEMLDDIQTRFELSTKGEYEKDSSNWPICWTFTIDDGPEFVKVLNRFSSNYAPNFGRLLTPLVNGMRVAGPFRPQWYQHEDIPKLVFIDGEGLGHTPDSASSIPTKITQQYELADSIVLVDNATLPVQAAIQEFLRSIASSGNHTKLQLVFTHFDQVIGDNLPNVESRKNHVLASLEGVLSMIENEMGEYVGKRLRRQLEDKVFFVGGIQNILSEKARFTLKELNRLIGSIESYLAIEGPIKVIPVYDVGNLIISIHRATTSFHSFWNARLKLELSPDVRPDHWARVKALSRRFAYQWADHYATLRPVADFIKVIQERLALFISSPRLWKAENATDEMKQEAVAMVSQEVFTRLHLLGKERLFIKHVKDWIQAYEHRGIGSTRLRARDIQGIYEVAAAIPTEKPSLESADFLDSIRKLFKEAAEAAGAEVM